MLKFRSIIAAVFVMLLCVTSTGFATKKCQYVGSFADSIVKASKPSECIVTDKPYAAIVTDSNSDTSYNQCVAQCENNLWNCFNANHNGSSCYGTDHCWASFNDCKVSCSAYTPI